MESTLSPFVDETYTADRNIVKHCHLQYAKYISKERNVSEEDVLKVLAPVIQPNQGEYKDARMQVLVKNKYGDREVKVMPASQFFSEVEANNYHLSPSMVAYKHSDEEQSVNAIGTEKFLKLRKYYKGLKQKASDEGDEFGKKAFHEIQNALKIFNNAQSGAMSSRGTALNNKSGHTTLTSICRALTSTANFCNEKLIAGNRFYFSPQVVMENMLSQLVTLDLKRMQSVMDRLGMVHATVEQVMAMVIKNSVRYWKNPTELAVIEGFLNNCRPIELTAILCNMDLVGLNTTNRKVLFQFFDDFCHIPGDDDPVNNGDHVKPDNSDRYVLCLSKMMKKPTDEELNKLNAYHILVEEKWRDFIECFLKTPIPPSSVHGIPNMVREVVQTSDTDSSIYTVDLVVEDYSDDMDTKLRLNGVLTYFIRMISIHQHQQLSKNMNVANRHLKRLNMKNEYLFGGYVTTEMSKHYFATQMMVEGVLNKKIEMEIKGVHLRSSNVAKNIKDFAHGLMREILDCIYSGVPLEAAEVLHKAGDLERAIFKEIREGSWTWLSRKTIKGKDVYTKPMSSIYMYHLLWDEVFADKYGKSPDPSYAAVKINNWMKSKSDMEDYYDRIEDKDLVERMKAFLAKYDKPVLKSFYVPSDVLPRLGELPAEMIEGGDIRAIISQNLKSVYAVLEACGLYINNEKNTRLISDEH